MKKLSILFLITLCGVLTAQNPWKDVYKESAWIDRDSWQKPLTLALSKANELTISIYFKKNERE